MIKNIKNLTSFSKVFIFFFLLFSIKITFISCQRGLSIQFDLSNINFDNYDSNLKNKIIQEFNIISKLIKSIYITKGKFSEEILSPNISNKEEISCGKSRQSFKIQHYTNTTDIDYLFIVNFKNTTQKKFFVGIDKCGYDNERKRIAIVNIGNFEKVKSEFENGTLQNSLRWKIFKEVFLFTETKLLLIWENFQISFRAFHGSKVITYYEAFKKYMNLLGKKRSLNNAPPNYKYANDTVHIGWSKVIGTSDIFLGSYHSNYDNTTLSEMGANLINDIYPSLQINKFDYLPLNNICFRIDRKCLNIKDFVTKYFVDYSFSTEINEDNAKMIYYMKTKKSFQQKKCSKYFGDPLDEKILKEKELTINYKVKQNFYKAYKINNILKLKKSIPLENTFYTSQRTYLLNQSPKCPNKHPRTVFFVSTYCNKTYQELKKDYNIDEVLIKDPKFFMSYSLNKEREIFAEVMSQNNFLTRNLTEDENVIWYLQAPRNLLNLNKYQVKYRYLNSMLYKDGLWRVYKKFHDMFPEDYNFVPYTYIYPENKKEILTKFKDYHFNKNEAWMFKPRAGSEGAGIYIIKDWDEIKNIKDPYVLNQYLLNPYLISKKKFDIRCYVLITGTKPLKIYFYREGYVRFPTVDYNLDEKDLHNAYVHITNTIQNEKNKEVYNDGKDLDDRSSFVWRLKIFEDWCKENNIDYEEIRRKFSDIFIKMTIAYYKQLSKKLGKGVAEDRNFVQIYGYDMMLDENLNPVLIEINSKPGIAKDNRMETYGHFLMIPDMLNIKGVVPFAHDGTEELFDKDIYQYKDEVQEAVDDALCEFERPTGLFDRIFPLKENIEKYKKFFEDIEPENKLLWETMLVQ